LVDVVYDCTLLRGPKRSQVPDTCIFSHPIYKVTSAEILPEKGETQRRERRKKKVRREEGKEGERMRMNFVHALE
jgi:hypothetical protein